MKVENLTQVTPWKRALNAARITVGKQPIDREPYDSWKAKMLLAEHSPIRLIEYEWIFRNIKYWIVGHFVRHHIGCEKFVCSSREDRNKTVTNRNELPQGREVDMLFTANAQALINISKVRLCRCAHPETRQAWQAVKKAISEIDPVMSDKMQPSCVHNGFCPEPNTCGYTRTGEYHRNRENLKKTDYDQ